MSTASVRFAESNSQSFAASVIPAEEDETDAGSATVQSASNDVTRCDRSNQ